MNESLQNPILPPYTEPCQGDEADCSVSIELTQEMNGNSQESLGSCTLFKSCHPHSKYFSSFRMALIPLSSSFGILPGAINFCPWVSTTFTIAYFEMTVDSHAVLRNNAEIFCLHFTQFLVNGNILKNHSITSQLGY